MKQYVCDYWQAWLGGAALGIGIALVAPWIPGSSWVRKLLTPENGVILLWVWLISLLALILSAPHAIEFARRLW